MKKRLTYSVIALALLIAYYIGLTQIQVAKEQGSAFLQLVFVGYFTLGVVFGFFFSDKGFIDFALTFALGFLGSLFSVVIYRSLFGSEGLTLDVITLANLFVASVLFGGTTFVGTLVKALIVEIWRRLFKRSTIENM